MERIETLESTACDHQWRYYVDLQNGAVSTRRCERCGERRRMMRTATAIEPALPV
jgi:uncharacterized OB-fold protein